MNENLGPWMDAKEAAIYLKRQSKSAWRTINRLAKAGRIKAGHDGKRFLFTADQLDQFLLLNAKEVRQ